MTNKQKIAILKKMVGYIERGECTFLCPAFTRATRRSCDPEIGLKELGLKKPRGSVIVKFGDIRITYWWKDFDSKPRLRALNSLIKRLSK